MFFFAQVKINNDLAKAQNLIKMSLSVHRSVVESFKFNGKNIMVVHIKNVGHCFVSMDVSKAVG